MKSTRLLLIPLTAALLASCSSGGGGGQSSASSATTPSTTSETSSATGGSSQSSSYEVPDNVDAYFWSTGSQGMTTQLQTLATEFEEAVKENTGKTVHMHVTVEGSYKDIADKINKGLTVGNIPNMCVAYPDTVADILAKEIPGRQYLYDLEEYINDPDIGFGTQEYLGDDAAYDEDDIVYTFLDEGRHYAREGMFSYPFMKSSEVMFYNVHDVERAYKFFKPNVLGIDNIRADLAQMDWAEFTTLLASVMEHKEDILSTLQRAAWYDSDSNWLISQLYQKEIPYTDLVDGKGVIALEEEKNLSAAATMVDGYKDLYDRGLITTGGTENTYGSNAFVNGEVLFSIGSSGGTGYNMPDGLEPSDIGVVPVPAANGNPSYVSQGPTLCFLKNQTITEAENKAQMYYAWQFAKFLTNPANNVRLCIRGSEGYLPIRYSAYESAAYMEFLEDESIYASSAKVLINEISGKYYNAPVFPGTATLRDGLGTAIPYVFAGEKTSRAAISDAIDAAKKKMEA